jgi:branched-chain amino acid transport system ATP-binding protein
MGMLETHDLSRRFGSFTAVHQVDLTVDAGEIHAIIGPNGAGKTTLFNLITGAIAPSTGRVVFSGTDITGWSPQRVLRQGILRSFQISKLFPQLTVRQNVELMAYGRAQATGSPFARLTLTKRQVAERVDAALDRIGIAGLAEHLAGALSHGDRRLVEIAMALAADPLLLLLDEPTAGMSTMETRKIAGILRGLAPDITIVIVEHDMSVVMSISDRVSVLHRGEILAVGTPDAIRANREVKRVYFGDAA